MCIPPNVGLFVRRDNSATVEGKLPDLADTKVSPASHMNYNGGGSYNASGYLSLFEYNPDQVSVLYRRETYVPTSAAARAMLEYNGQYIHFFFLNMAALALVALNEENVHGLPAVGRTPTIFNTDACRPPARRTLDGEVLEYANRYINEFLLAGAWPLGTLVITEPANASRLLGMMANRNSLQDICKTAQQGWPCPDQDPGPGSGSSGGGSGVMAS